MATGKRLNLDMEHFAPWGMILSLEEQLILKTSLPVLKIENNFSSVTFWGKVMGTQGDYFIAQGTGKDCIRNRMSFYSLDGQLWRLLLLPTDKDMRYFYLVRGRFTGDPTEIHYYYERTGNYWNDDVKHVIKEETRLSTLVKLVDIETSIAPRNALVLNPSGIITPNECFKGLSPNDAEKLASYGHSRLPLYNEDYISCMSGINQATDVLEPIDKDKPAGVWVLQWDDAREVVTLRNMWWPGSTFYHVVNTPEFGRLYMGFGERNDDLPFMM